MRAVFNVFTGTLDFVEAAAAPGVTTSLDTEAGDHIVTEAGDYLVPES